MELCLYRLDSRPAVSSSRLHSRTRSTAAGPRRADSNRQQKSLILLLRDPARSAPTSRARARRATRRPRRRNPPPQHFGRAFVVASRPRRRPQFAAATRWPLRQRSWRMGHQVSAGPVLCASTTERPVSVGRPGGPAQRPPFIAHQASRPPTQSPAPPESARRPSAARPDARAFACIAALSMPPSGLLRLVASSCGSLRWMRLVAAGCCFLLFVAAWVCCDLLRLRVFGAGSLPRNGVEAEAVRGRSGPG